MSLTSKEFQLGEEIVWKNAGEGIQRQLFGYNKQVMMVKVKFEKGAVGSLHQHPHTQVSYVESGLFEITIDGKKQILKTGDGFFVNPDLIHGAVCLEAGVLVDVFNPMREDFL
ncbi:cupin domain-containing protein [Pedobacter alpinus]|uniref:Cupin domain-containing protein n=1 Tax=Pedobacter alpinus TaxID=1590643 RepID=A0ABW5TNF0_9SPHI